MGLLGSIREYFERRKFQRTVFAQALKLHTQEYLHGGTVLSSVSQETKERFVQELMQRIANCFQAENPAMAVREAIVEHVLGYAQLQVLCMTEEEKAQTFYSSNPYISGQLCHQIELAAEHVDEVARFKWESEANSQDLMDFCNTRCALHLYFMNAFNLARMELGDQTDPDWFRPLVEAQLVYEENTIRDKLALPLLTKDMIEALAYSVMWNKVMAGDANPFYEWCQTWPDKYLAGRGPLPTR
ncbi:hypothetical protein [Sphingorhabdus sp.]|uniref:hypothetical protein n=1 Tax=Sphingorhabdus sp. TaxID=1902408 RepID=UPI0032B7159E